MTDEEIVVFVDQLEKLWIENYVAKRYLKNNCGIADPEDLLTQEAAKIPRQAGLYRLFEPARQAIGQGLQDSELFEKLRQALLKPLKD